MNSIAHNTIVDAKGNSVFTLLKSDRFLQLCAAVLVAQLGLAALLGLTQRKATFASEEPLFGLEQDEFNHIAIDNGNETVTLKRKDELWLLDGDVPLPVDSARLSTLFSSLVELQVGLPVASTVNAQEQLEVSDDKYQRKLVINSDPAHTFMLGTSPGLRKAHLRRAGANDIYSAPLPVSDVPASADEWLDKSLLTLQDISKIASDAITFERSGSGEEEIWRVLGNNDDSKSLNTERLTSVIEALETLQVTGLSEDPPTSSIEDSANEAPDTGANSKSETIDFLVTSEGDELEFVLQKADSNTIVKRNDINQPFTAPISLFDQLSVLGSEADWLLDVAEEMKSETPAEK